MSSDLSEFFPSINYPIDLPDGYTQKDLMLYLQSFALEGSNGDELRNYLKDDLERFLHTLQLVPQPPSGPATSKLLEIGANPYFMSMLLEKFSGYQCFYTNYFGNSGNRGKQVMRRLEGDESINFEYVECNVDIDEIPYQETFDVILFCEVLEHLIVDPMEALRRIKDKLAPGGTLILTTPNVNRLENISKMLCGANIYDPYSAYGVYGRHNREYNKHELSLLMQQCGFDIEIMYTSDVHENHAPNFLDPDKYKSIIFDVNNRELDLGQYIFTRASNSDDFRPEKPEYLYRSYS